MLSDFNETRRLVKLGELQNAIDSQPANRHFHLTRLGRRFITAMQAFVSKESSLVEAEIALLHGRLIAPLREDWITTMAIHRFEPRLRIELYRLPIIRLGRAG